MPNHYEPNGLRYYHWVVMRGLMLSENAEILKNTLGPLLGVLRTPNIYWHTTPYDKFKKILSEGIRPSDGSIESVYKTSLGSCLKSVSLFDFFSVDEKTTLEAGQNWDSFLFDWDAALKIFIGIDRNRLALDKLQTQNDFLYKNLPDDAANRKRIAQVECWYQDTIDVTNFTEIILIKQLGRPLKYERLSFDNDVLIKIEPIKQEWERLEDQKRDDDDRNGIRCPAEALLGRPRRRYGK